MTAYRVQTKRHRLTFRLELLEPVLSGAKCCTIRFSAVAARVRPGDALVLAFGAYNRPTVLTAAAARVETVLLEPELARAYTLPETVLSLKAEYAFYAQPIVPDANTPPELVAALAASGGDFAALLQEANARDAEHAICIWWRLTP